MMRFPALSQAPQLSPIFGTGTAGGADDGNRTRVFGLGSGHSAIELHLRERPLIIIHFPKKVKYLSPTFSYFSSSKNSFFRLKSPQTRKERGDPSNTDDPHRSRRKIPRDRLEDW